MAGEAPESNEQLPPTQNGPIEEVNPPPPIPESRMPSRKDTSLREFLSKMDDYAPIVSVVATSCRL